MEKAMISSNPIRESVWRDWADMTVLKNYTSTRKHPIIFSQEIFDRHKNNGNRNLSYAAQRWIRIDQAMALT
jgi:hypothetical protein